MTPSLRLGSPKLADIDRLRQSLSMNRAYRLLNKITNESPNL